MRLSILVLAAFAGILAYSTVTGTTYLIDWVPTWLSRAMTAAVGIACVAFFTAVAVLSHRNNRCPRPLTLDVIRQALMDTTDLATYGAPAFLGPLARDGHGYSVKVDLPPGITAAEVIASERDLADAMGVPRHNLVLEQVPSARTGGRLRIWIADPALDTPADPQPTGP